MKNKMWIIMTLLLVLPGFMLTVACQKRVAVQQQPVAVVEEKEVVVEEKEEVVVVVEEEKKMDAMVMAEDIYFDFDKSSLTPAAQENLLMKAQWLRENPDATTTIEGHADDRGTNEYNLALGDRRADSARGFLVNLGISASRLSTISYGEERPVCTQRNEECWAKNRRGNFVIN
jgi:peptidoglycan-associated lipoprotein